MRLSDRMSAVAAMVTAGGVLADVGTDHGYVPIALVERGIVPRAIAMDLREGPLAQAKKNIAMCGLANKIETRLSDGVEALAPGEADSIVIAGMGGELVVHILSNGRDVCRSVKELILQPQSELDKVRKYLRENEYDIQREDMICEDGKYYPMMKVVPGEGENERLEHQQVISELGIPVCDRYGGDLLWRRNPILLEFLYKEQELLERIETGLKRQPRSEGILSRLVEVEQKIRENARARGYIERE